MDTYAKAVKAKGQSAYASHRGGKHRKRWRSEKEYLKAHPRYRTKRYRPRSRLTPPLPYGQTRV